LAGLDPAGVAATAELGRNVGVAFQIVDDLLDYGFGAVNLDKRTFSDAKNGLVTLPMLLYFRSVDADTKSEMLSLLSQSDQLAAQQGIQQKLIASGAFQEAREMAENRIAQGIPVLKALPESPARAQLLRLCSLMTERSV
jgi:geranylgeranyl pyrophosphate synthase